MIQERDVTQGRRAGVAVPPAHLPSEPQVQAVASCCEGTRGEPGYSDGYGGDSLISISVA